MSRSPAVLAERVAWTTVVIVSLFSTQYRWLGLMIVGCWILGRLIGLGIGRWARRHQASEARPSERL